jgi:hypothetical protein
MKKNPLSTWQILQANTYTSHWLLHTISVNNEDIILVNRKHKKHPHKTKDRVTRTQLKTDIVLKNSACEV